MLKGRINGLAVPDNPPLQAPERRDALSAGPDDPPSRASLPASPFKTNTIRRPSFSRYARYNRGSVLAIHSSFAPCRTVRFSGFFHSAYRLFFNPLADRKSTRLNSSHANISYAVF